MDISGNYTLYAPRESVWNALHDPDLLRRTVPGCERLERQSDDTYALRLNVGIAAVKGLYDGTLQLTDLLQPESYRIHVEGRGSRGMLHGDGTLHLDEREPATTVVTYKGSAHLGGAIAGIGMRVAAGAAHMLIRSYFSALADVLSAQAPSGAAGETLAGVGTQAIPSAAATPAEAATPDASQEAPQLGRVAPAGPAVATLAAASRPLAASPPTVTVTAPAAAGGPRRGPLMRLARSTGLTDGTLESERAWARRMIGGGIIAALVVGGTATYIATRR